MANSGVLLVLDNLETLLTPDGTWRDPRWEPLIAALTGHDGESRVIMTSRIAPAGLRRGDAAGAAGACAVAGGGGRAGPGAAEPARPAARDAGPVRPPADAGVAATGTGCAGCCGWCRGTRS